jgi:anaphase-promoting complex subunit 10
MNFPSIDASSSTNNIFAGLQEVGKHAAWNVSTAKHGNGVQQLLDDNIETFWQSDGAQPHTIDVQFNKLLRVCEIALYLDFTLDESYTPKKFTVRCGTNILDLREVHTQEMEEPKGWVRVPLKSGEPGRDYVCCNMLQIGIVENHQNGRDTHIRQVKIFSSRVHSIEEENTSVEMSQWCTIR